MARRTLRPRDNPKGILIAIDAHIDNMQDIAAALALLPKALTAAREKHSRARFDAFR